MNAFTFSPEAYADNYNKHGYIHIKDGVHPEFLAFAREQLRQCRSFGHNELASRAIANKKKQYLFDLPDEFLPPFINTIATISGWPSEQITLSERHIMIYESNAPAVPQLHKDRLASQISVGIPLEDCSDARIALVPDRDRDLNLLNRATYTPMPFSEPQISPDHPVDVSDAEDRDEETHVIQLDARPGDIVMFAGSDIYHGRLNSADSAVLYFKANCMRLDPLGEDPSTIAQRATSLRILRSIDDQALLYSKMELSPRLQGVTSNYTRFNWTPILCADVAGQEPVPISEGDLRLLFALDGRRAVLNVLTSLGIPPQDFAAELSKVRRLTASGIIDVINVSDGLHMQKPQLDLSKAQKLGFAT